MPPDRIASLLLLLAPLWPVLAAVVLCIPRGTRSDEEARHFDRECRIVSALSAAISCGSLLAAMLLAFTEVRAPEISARSAWLVIPAINDIVVAFQLRVDSLSGPAAIAASLLGCVALLTCRHTADVNQAPPYRTWLLLLAAVQVLLLANDLVLLVAALIVSELLCRSLVPTPLSGVRSLTLLPFAWIVLQWLVGFTTYSVDAMASEARWLVMAKEGPIFALVSGLCLLTFVLGRMGLYPFCVDVDRVYDETPGRLYWFGCLGSWIPAQYVLLRFWPALGASTLGVPSLTSLAVLLTVLSAWMALTRPHRAGALAMIGVGTLASTWTALGSGLLIGPRIAEAASLSLLLLWGALIILADASGWLSASFDNRGVQGRRTLWVALILLASGIGLQRAWEVTFAGLREVATANAQAVDEMGEELIEPPPLTVHVAVPMLMVFAHGLLWMSAGCILSPVLLGRIARRADEATTDLPDIVLPATREADAESIDGDSQTPAPVLRPHPSTSSATWLSRRLCGGLVLSSILWGPILADLFQRRGMTESARLAAYLTAAPWGVMLPAGLLGLVVGCWMGFAAAHRRTAASEMWKTLADAGRRLFYLPEIGKIVAAPFRQMLELPLLMESLWVPTAEILPEESSPPSPVATEAVSSPVAAWLLPLAGLTSIALIWSLLLLW